MSSAISHCLNSKIIVFINAQQMPRIKQSIRKHDIRSMQIIPAKHINYTFLLWKFTRKKHLSNQYLALILSPQIFFLNTNYSFSRQFPLTTPLDLSFQSDILWPKNTSIRWLKKIINTFFLYFFYSKITKLCTHLPPPTSILIIQISQWFNQITFFIKIITLKNYKFFYLLFFNTWLA